VAAPPPLPAAAPAGGAPFDFTAAPRPVTATYAGAAPVTTAILPPRERRAGTPAWVHLVPAGLLFLALVIVIFKDLLFTPAGTGDNIPVDPNPRVKVFFDGKDQQNTMRFGLSTADNKMLTFDGRGRTNSTVVRIDGRDRMFGFGDGKYTLPETKSGDYGGKKAAWYFEDMVEVTQTVERIPGEPQVVEKGEYKRLIDTVLVRYTIENKSGAPRKVGLRVVLDTLIGKNDGVPFTVPGITGLVDTKAEFKTAAEVPDYIQALEHGDLKNPGTIAQVNLKLGGSLEPPSRVLLTYWPGQDGLLKWEVPLESIKVVKEQPDSAVVIYWDEKELRPGDKREVGFSYGLGNLAASDRLGLTTSAPIISGKEFTVTGLVASPKGGDRLTLELPEGFSLVEGSATQDVPPQPPDVNRPSPVTWRVRAGSAGSYPLVIRLNSGERQERRIFVVSRSIF